MEPAMWRVGRSPEVKATGARTKARKMIPPIQTTRVRSIKNFKKDMGGIIECGMASKDGSRRLLVVKPRPRRVLGCGFGWNIYPQAGTSRVTYSLVHECLGSFFLTVGESPTCNVR